MDGPQAFHNRIQFKESARCQCDH